MLGGVDGLITSVAILSSSYLSGLSQIQTIGVSLSTLLADAVSMGASEYLSSSEDRTEVRSAVKRGVFCSLSFLGSGALPLGFASLFHPAADAIRFPVLLVCGGVVALFLSYLRQRVFETKAWIALVETVSVVSVAIGVAVGTNLVVQAVGAG